jgi:pimeloyl-ACP methyl ester carboxylesterase/N-acetylglutamate synthase-like GNAT family acetyltransferase
MTRLVLLPGLGASGRLFDPQRRAFPALEVPEWLAPRAGETLPAYGHRMAAAVRGYGSSLVLGGVSFGGAVAQEMARHLQPRAVVLIASCRSGAELTRPARALAAQGPRVPAWLAKPPRALWPVLAHTIGAESTADRALLYELIRTADTRVVRWGLGALAAWRPAGTPAAPLRHIHGTRDRLIRAARVKADVRLPGGGHFINVTHADAVNAFVREALEEVAIREATPSERERVRAFYVAMGHSGQLGLDDRLLVAERDGEILGAVRLCVEEGAQVLRTMRVRPDAQRRGLGRALLRRFVTLLAKEECFCLPWAHLEGFYGEIGFQRIAPAALPPHLAARLAGYQRERPDAIAMRRP